MYAADLFQQCLSVSDEEYYVQAECHENDLVISETKWPHAKCSSALDFRSWALAVQFVRPPFMVVPLH